VEDAAALELATFADPEMAEELGLELVEPGTVERGAGLRGRPRVEAALDPLGVGIERRVEAAFRRLHLPQHPFADADGDIAVAVVAELEVGAQVAAREQ